MVRKFEVVSIVVTKGRLTISAIDALGETFQEVHEVMPDGTLDCTKGNFEDEGDIWVAGLAEPLIALSQEESPVIEIMRQLYIQ
jgi:hypothetical protein